MSGPILEYIPAREPPSSASPWHETDAARRPDDIYQRRRRVRGCRALFCSSLVQNNAEGIQRLIDTEVLVIVLEAVVVAAAA